MNEKRGKSIKQDDRKKIRTKGTVHHIYMTGKEKSMTHD
jgi:hypothetical protein